MEHQSINHTKAEGWFWKLANSFRPFLVLIYLFFGSLSYGQFDTVFTVPKEMQLRVLDSITFALVYTSKSDSIPFYLRKLESYSKELHDYRFLIYSELYRMRSEYFTNIFNAQKESIRFNQLLNIARENQDTLMIFNMSIRFGEILRDDSKYAMAISYYLITYKYLPFVDPSYHNVNIELLELQLAAFYYHIEDFKKSLDILENSQVSKSINYNGMGCYDLWSQLCLKLKDYECSKKMIHKAYSIYLVSDTSSWFFNGWDGIFKGNLGKIEFAQQNYIAAIPFFKDGIQITAKALMHDNVASFGNLLAQCYIHTQQASKALELLPMIKSAIYQKDDPQLFVDYFKLCLVLSANISQAGQNLHYFDSLQHYNIKLQDRKNKDAKIKEDLALEISNQEYFQTQMENKIKNQLKIRNSIICFVIFLSIFVSIAIYRKQKQLVAQKKLTLEIKEKAEVDLAAAKEELYLFKEFLIEKNRHIQTLESSLSSMDSNSDMEKLKVSVILTEDDWLKFKSLFNKVYPNYIDQLRSNFPLLTQSEIRYFHLLKLDLDNREMASILGVSPGTMRTIKSRICKKLNLNEKANLSELISKL